MSNRSDQHQTRHFVGHDLGPNCLRRWSANATSSREQCVWCFWLVILLIWVQPVWDDYQQMTLAAENNVSNVSDWWFPSFRSNRVWMLCLVQLHHQASWIRNIWWVFTCTVKPVLRGYSKIGKTKIFMTNGSLMKVESIVEYFWPTLSENRSWKTIWSSFWVAT